MIIAVEGIDGAGKHTLTTRLTAAITATGRTVATLAFPRYTIPPLGPLVRAMLDGDPGLAAVAGSPRATALLFALDRANALPELTRLAAGHDVLIVDRYVASNAAYGAARVPPEERDAFPDWVAAVELTDLGLPRPDLQVLLRVPAHVARAAAQERAARDAERKLDTFESDDGLQDRCAAVYERLAAAGWVSPWLVVDRDSGAQAVMARLFG